MEPNAENLWDLIREDAERNARDEPLLASFLYNTILNHETLERALAYHLANKLANANLQPISLMELFLQIMQQDPTIPWAVRADIIAIKQRDPACHGWATPLLYFKGYNAIESYRMAHWLWLHQRYSMALALQSRISESFGVDIHPTARIGYGFFIDHATGVVVGETAVIGNNVSMLHGVTLGGIGNETGDRHPKIAFGAHHRGRRRKDRCEQRRAPRRTRSLHGCRRTRKDRGLPPLPRPQHRNEPHHRRRRPRRLDPGVKTALPADFARVRSLQNRYPRKMRAHAIAQNPPHLRAQPPSACLLTARSSKCRRILLRGDRW